MITLTNGLPQSLAGLVVPNGSISLQLNVDGAVIATPFGIVLAEIPIVFQFSAAGAILPNAPATAAKIYSNLELNPQNANGLGTYYLVTFYDANGARLNQSPMWWQFNQATNSTVDIGTMTPFATIGGNVIFYPTSFPIIPPAVATLGGVFSNVGAAHKWISAIDTDGTVVLSQPAFSDISGLLTNAQLPSPFTFTTITASGLIIGQANLQLGVAGTTSGQIVLEGSTSGSCTITAPGTAGVVTNPILISNSVTLAATCVLSAPGGVIISAGNISASETLTTATQPTFRLTDSELTLGNAVTSVTGSVAAVRGNNTVAAGTTITGASYIYGTQGKLTIQGALNSTAEVSAGIVGQLDLSTASASSAPIAAAWFDCGASMSAAVIASPAAIDGVVIYNTTNALIHSVLRVAANATYLFDLSDLAFGGKHFITTGASGGSNTKCLVVLIDGVPMKIQLFA